MTFKQAIKICLNKYASPFGRASRTEFWYFMLMCGIGMGVGWVMYSIAFANAIDEYGIPQVTNTLIIASLAIQLWNSITFVPAIAVSVRRLHDTEKTGWWWWLTITGIGIIVLIIFYATKGENKKNIYGENPLKQKNKTTQYQKIEFFNAIKIAYQKYNAISGRASRTEFWYFGIFTFVMFNAITTIIQHIAEPENFIIYHKYMTIPWIIIFTIPSITLQIRRLHDIGKSGWWMMLGFTIIGLIPLIVWNCTKGENEKNKYGKAIVT